MGLVLTSLPVLIFFTPPNLSATRQAASKSAAVKKVSTEQGKTQTAPKSTGKASATGTAKGKSAAKGPAGSPAKSHSRQPAGSAKGSTKSTLRGSAKAGSRTASKRSQKTVYRQQQPEPERIREIQQALSEHGYPLEVNGAWDASTVEALAKFQTEQKIENLSGKGKLDSMTLIALGLGPKREPPSGQAEEPKQTPEGKLP
jgi:hypothetical protein